MIERKERQFVYSGDKCTVGYLDGPEIAEMLKDKLLDWFFTYHCFSGESIHQCDEPQMTAPQLLSDIAEKIFGFDARWEEEK